jgi:hypothetical protein
VDHLSFRVVEDFHAPPPFEGDVAFAAAAIFIFESSRVRRCQLLDVTKGHLISSQILKIPLESFLGRHVAMPRASTYT